MAAATSLIAGRDELRAVATPSTIRVSALASPWGDGDAVVTVESTPSGLRIGDGSREVEIPFARLTAVATHTTVTLTSPQARRPLKLDFAPVTDGGGRRFDPIDPTGLVRGANLHHEASANGMRDLLVALKRAKVPTTLAGRASIQGGFHLVLAVLMTVVLGTCELALAAGGADGLHSTVTDGDAVAAVLTIMAVGAGLVAIPFTGTVRYFVKGLSPVAVFDDLTLHPDRPFGQVIQAWAPVVSGPLLATSPGRVEGLPLFRPWWRLAGLAAAITLMAIGGPVDEANVAEGAARVIGFLIAIAAVVGAYFRPDADSVEMDAATGAGRQRLRAALYVVFAVAGFVALALGTS